MEIMTLLAKLFGKKFTTSDTFENTKTTLTYYKFRNRLYFTNIEQITVEGKGDLFWSPGIAERMSGLNKIIKSKAIQNLGASHPNSLER